MGSYERIELTPILTLNSKSERWIKKVHTSELQGSCCTSTVVCSFTAYPPRINRTVISVGRPSLPKMTCPVASRSGIGPGEAWAFACIIRPKPSEYSTICKTGEDSLSPRYETCLSCKRTAPAGGVKVGLDLLLNYLHTSYTEPRCGVNEQC